MRRLALLLLAAASTAAAHAQGALFPAGDAGRAAPHWRAGLDAGLSATLGGVASVELERTVSGPFSVGARALIYDSQRGLPMDDGGGIDGSAAEAFASVGLRRRVADLRIFAGVGASSVRSFASGLPPEPGDFGTPNRSDARAVRPHLVGGAGVDLYPLPGVGVGGTDRAAASATAVPLTTVSLGLRVRLAR